MSWNVYHDRFGFYIWGEHMKKYITLLFSILLFMIPIKVHAVSGPPTLPGNFPSSNLITFLSSAAAYELMNSKGFGVNNDEVLTISQILNSRPVQDSISVTEKPMNTMSWTPYLNWYDSQGNIVDPQTCTIVFAKTDIGTAVYVYDTVTGDIVTEGETFETSTSTMWADTMGQIVDSEALRFADSTIAHTQNSVFVGPQIISEEVKEQYQNYAFSGYLRSNNQNFTCFVPNGATASCRILPIDGYYTKEWSGGSFSPFQGIGLDFVCNNPNDVIFSGSSSYATVKTTTRTVDGRTYTYTPRWYNSFNVLDRGGEIAYKAPTNEQYNTAISNSQYVVYGDPVEPGDTINNYYNYTYVTENPPTINRQNNNNFDPEKSINNQNYPTNNTYNEYNYNPSSNSYIYNYYNYMNSPGQGENIGNVDENELTNGLPILNNLQKRFPFSIPFDIYNLLSGLSAERTTPYINTDIVIPGINYTWHFEYDLHAFDDLAALFRTLFLIFFIIGLAWLSYDHFFGS